MWIHKWTYFNITFNAKFDAYKHYDAILDRIGPLQHGGAAPNKLNFSLCYAVIKYYSRDQLHEQTYSQENK